MRAPGPTDPAPTAKLNASSRPSYETGPTPPATKPAHIVRSPSHPGSTTTTNDDPTAPSATEHPSRGYPPPDQRGWDLHLGAARASRCVAVIFKPAFDV